MDTSNIILIIIAIIVGAFLGWIFAKTTSKAKISTLEAQVKTLTNQLATASQITAERDALKLQTGTLQAHLEGKNEQLDNLNKRFTVLEEQLERIAREKSNLEINLAQSRITLEKATEKHVESQTELEKLNERFTKEFENLANKILTDNSTKFADQNKKNIEQILSPLQEKITVFEKRVEDTHKDTIERQSMLRQQILSLKELNQQMSKETSNLTKALKGDAKMRGNWGELVLERVLEKSGLEKGQEYEVQQSYRTEDGSTRFPDVVINLPGGKKMIIDSKVSLNAYERYVNEEDESLQEVHLKAHVAALKKHVNDLSAKNYHEMYAIESPDFVLLFVPIEPAFAMALNNDAGLYSDAFDKNIVIVTPTTLLATLRTIDTMWQNEKQQRNALDIAAAAGSLYDKFVLLTDDLIKVGTQLETVQKTYKTSMNKLSEGSGNLIGKAERLKKLGAKANKSLNDKLVTRAIENDPDYLDCNDNQ